DPVHLRAELDDVEVALEDLLLVEPRLEPPRQQRFLELAIEASAMGEQLVLDQLLADRRAAAREPLVAQIDLETACDLVELAAVVVVKPAVLGGDERARQE